MAINRSTLRIEAELNTYLAGIADAHTRALVEAWIIAWDQVAGELDAAAMDLVNAASGGRVTRTMVIRSGRAQAALDALAAALDDLSVRTGSIVTRDLHGVIAAAATAEADMIASQLTGTRRADLAGNLVRADARQIAAMVERATQRITAETRPIGPKAHAAIRRELLRGTAVGANPRTTARRMVAGIEDRFNGGLTRAMTVARTEMLDAARTASRNTDKANADVLEGWVWVAHLGPRTCRSCIANHGTVHDVDEPGPDDHPNGRCARVPKTKSWADLGYPGIQDPPDATPNADAWFNRLSAGEQQSILGDRGYAAWKAGDYPRSAWTTKRETSGWRDSMVPSRPPA